MSRDDPGINPAVERPNFMDRIVTRITKKALMDNVNQIGRTNENDSKAKKRRIGQTTKK